MSLKMRLNGNDEARLNRELNRLAEQTGQTLKEVLPSQMRLLATDLAFVTIPRGKGTSDNKQNMERVMSRIRTIYPSVGKIVNELKERNPGVAGRFAGLIDKRQYAKAQNLASQYISNLTVGTFDGGALHKAQSESKEIRQRRCVPGYSRVESYAKKTARKVGYAKGGFATGAKQLGGVRGIPGFATRQKSPGTGRITGDGRTLSVTLTNNVRHIEKALLPGAELAAVNSRTRAVSKLLEKIQTNKIRRSVRRV